MERSHLFPIYKGAWGHDSKVDQLGRHVTDAVGMTWASMG